MDQRRSWEENGIVLESLLCNLSSSLQKIGFGEVLLSLPGEKITRPEGVEMSGVKEVRLWDGTSLTLAVVAQLTEGFALAVRVFLRQEASESLELEKTFLCYPSVEEDVKSVVQECAERIQKQAFLESRWENELQHWIGRGYLPRIKTLGCQKILRKYDRTGSMDASSIQFLNTCLSGQKVITKAQQKLFNEWRGLRDD